MELTKRVCLDSCEGKIQIMVQIRPLAQSVALAQVQASDATLIAAAATLAKNANNIGLFSAASSITVPSDLIIVTVSGTSTVNDSGFGRQFVYSSAVDTTYVSANPLTSFIDQADRGFLETGLSMSRLGASTGAAMVGVGTSGLTGTRSADFYIKQRGVLLSADTAVIGDGVTDSFAGTQRAIAVATGDAMYVPKGDFLMKGQITIPSSGLTMEGMGQDSRLILGGNYQSLLSAAATGRLRLYNMRLSGAGVVATSGWGLGLQFTGGESDIDLDTLWFDNFGNPSIQMAQSAVTTDQKIRFRNINVTNALQQTSAAEAGAIACYGMFSRLTMENIDVEAGVGDGTSTFGMGNGIIMSGLVSGLWWQEATLRSIKVRGVTKRGIAISNEDPAPDFRTGILTLEDIIARNCAWQGIKLKNVDAVRATNLYVDGCEATSTEVSGNLQGSIFFNGCEDLIATNIEVRNAGTDGVRVYGRQPPNGDTTGKGESRMILNGVTVRSTGLQAAAVSKAGVYIGHSTQAVQLTSAKLYDCYQGITIVYSNTLPTPSHINLTDVTIRRTTVDGIGINGATGQTVGPVFINNPDIQETGGNGIDISFANLVKIRGGNVSDSSTYGVTVSSCDEFWLSDCSIRNRVGVAQLYGVWIRGGIGLAEMHDNDLSNNGTGPVLYAATPTKMRARNNSPWLEGTSASYDPPSLALGISTALQSATVSGVELGDKVDVTWSADLSGATIRAEVAAANAIRWWITNMAGANPLDLAAGTAKFTVTKQQG